MIERRLFYLQTRLDATPRSLPTAAPGGVPTQPGSRIFRLIGTGRRAIHSAAGSR